jgi:hypothetical protein
VDCNTLPEAEHRALAALCAQQSKRPVEITDTNFKSMGVPPEADLSVLVDDGFLVRWGGRLYQIEHRCNCSYLRAAKKERRAISKSFANSMEQEQLPQPRPEFKSGWDAVGPPLEGTTVEDEGERTFVRSLVSQPLRSRGGSEEQNYLLSIADSPSQLAGQTVSGSRVPTEVAARRKRSQTTLAWMDRPVERWNSRCLAGYFDDQTFQHLQGRSADRYVMKPVIENFARMLSEGITASECKAMVDLYVQRNLGNDDLIISCWKDFFGQKGKLRKALTANSAGHYNNQPTAEDDDGSDWE